MMLRRRFKQSLTSDHHHHHPHLLSPLPSSSSSSIHLHSSPSSSSPPSFRLFSDSDPAMMSPTSVLESKSFSSCTASAAGLFSGDKRPARSLSIKLGIADALAAGEEGSSTAAVLFGSKLRVRDRDLPVDPPRSPPIEFGIKTRDSQLGLLESASASPPPAFGRSLSAKEMEMSEEYTCVISHGPNPRTTHIFDGCVVECCSGGDGGFSIAGKDHGELMSSCDSCGEENFSHERRRNEESMFDEEGF